jgi:hypothetical protein
MRCQSCNYAELGSKVGSAPNSIDRGARAEPIVAAVAPFIARVGPVVARIAVGAAPSAVGTAVSVAAVIVVVVAIETPNKDVDETGYNPSSPNNGAKGAAAAAAIEAAGKAAFWQSKSMC